MILDNSITAYDIRNDFGGEHLLANNFSLYDSK